ncbi:hypothetical protein OROGR_027880 [Orobanche gracilis]
MLISAMMDAYTAILELNYMELQTSLVGYILEMAYISVYLNYPPNARTPLVCGVILGIMAMVLYYIIRSQQVSISLQQNPPTSVIPQQSSPTRSTIRSNNCQHRISGWSRITND